LILFLYLFPVAQLRSALSKGPVLVLPTHRSYADFILISYLFFTLDLPLPIIAAGMDFKVFTLGFVFRLYWEKYVS